MKRALHTLIMAILAAEVLVVGQSADALRILKEVRQALGGEDRLDAVKTLAIEGTAARPGPDGRSESSGFEMAFALPDRFVRKDVMARINGMDIARSSGFNGDRVIEHTDTPPQMGSGAMMIFRAGPGSPPPGVEMTPEQIEAQRQATLANSRREFARFTLGMFATSFPSYPLEFSVAGVAESPDGKADVLDVKGASDFHVRLFVDQKTRLPLMLSWMDKEPLSISVSGGPGGMTMSHGAATGMAGGREMRMTGSPEDMQRMRAEMEARIKEAEASRRVVEYRMFYGDYKTFNGVKLPTKIQRMIDGRPADELELTRVRVNAPIDPGRFEIK